MARAPAAGIAVEDLVTVTAGNVVPAIAAYRTAKQNAMANGFSEASLQGKSVVAINKIADGDFSQTDIANMTNAPEIQTAMKTPTYENIRKALVLIASKLGFEFSDIILNLMATSLVGRSAKLDMKNFGKILLQEVVKARLKELRQKLDVAQEKQSASGVEAVQERFEKEAETLLKEIANLTALQEALTPAVPATYEAIAKMVAKMKKAAVAQESIEPKSAAERDLFEGWAQALGFDSLEDAPLAARRTIVQLAKHHKNLPDNHAGALAAYAAVRGGEATTPVGFREDIEDDVLSTDRVDGQSTIRFDVDGYRTARATTLARTLHDDFVSRLSGIFSSAGYPFTAA